MTQIYNIPIIARGRIIEPGEDAVEYSGRGGARFRTPDPHQHVHDLVLGNPVLLHDLMNTPMRGIIDFLAEVGKRLRLDDNPFLQESFALALQAGGLAEPILRGVYDGLPQMFNADALTALVEKSVGIPFLDGWVPSDYPHANCRVRPVGIVVACGGGAQGGGPVARGCRTADPGGCGRPRAVVVRRYG